MADQKLVEYIKASRLSGRTDREIRKTLTDIGWTEEPVNEAFQEAEAQSYTAPAPVQSDTDAYQDTNTLPSSPPSNRGRLFLLLATVGLLLLFAIIGVIIALRSNSPSPSSSSQSAAQRDKQRQTDIKNYASALTKYSKDHGRYPGVSGSGFDSTSGGSAGIFNKSAALKSYLSSFSTDPKNGQNLCQTNASSQDISCAYKYRVSSDGKSFVLWAVMENSYNNEGVYIVDSTGKHSLVSAEPTKAP